MVPSPLGRAIVVAAARVTKIRRAIHDVISIERWIDGLMD
jgi:hypothetical protein